MDYLGPVIKHVQDNEKTRKTTTGVAKQTGCSAGGAIVGEVCLGPVYGTINRPGIGCEITMPYPSVFELINELDDEQKQELKQAIIDLVGGISIPEFIEWYKDSKSPKALQAVIMKALNNKFDLISFIEGQKNATYPMLRKEN